MQGYQGNCLVDLCVSREVWGVGRTMVNASIVTLLSSRPCRSEGFITNECARRSRVALRAAGLSRQGRLEISGDIARYSRGGSRQQTQCGQQTKRGPLMHPSKVRMGTLVTEIHMEHRIAFDRNPARTHVRVQRQRERPPTPCQVPEQASRP